MRHLMDPPPPMTVDRERALYLEGVRLFNARAFFEAHEAWEDAWRDQPPGVKRDFYQGLIQCAVALEHYRRGNPRGAAKLYHRYRRRFEQLPAVFMGLDVGKFLGEMGDVLRPIVVADPAPAAEQSVLEPSRAPTIKLTHDPFDGDDNCR